MWKWEEMKSKNWTFILMFLLTSFPGEAFAVTPQSRPVFASTIYNNILSTSDPGVIGIPVTPVFGNRACYLDAFTTLQSSITTATELSYLSGVTGPIQAQINGITKASRTTNMVMSTFTIPALTGDYILNVNSSLGSISITLPDAVASVGNCVDVKDIGTNSVTVLPPVGQTVDSGSSDILNSGDSGHYCAVSSNWFIY